MSMEQCGKGMSCFKCGDYGHWAKDCPVRADGSQPAAQAQAGHAVACQLPSAHGIDTFKASTAGSCMGSTESLALLRAHAEAALCHVSSSQEAG